TTYCHRYPREKADTFGSDRNSSGRRGAGQRELVHGWNQGRCQFALWRSELGQCDHTVRLSVCLAVASRHRECQAGEHSKLKRFSWQGPFPVSKERVQRRAKRDNNRKFDSAGKKAKQMPALSAELSGKL